MAGQNNHQALEPAQVAEFERKIRVLLDNFDKIPVEILGKRADQGTRGGTRRESQWFEAPRAIEGDVPSNMVDLNPSLMISRNGTFTIHEGLMHARFTWKVFFQQKARFYLDDRVSKTIDYLTQFYNKLDIQAIMGLGIGDRGSRRLYTYGYKKLMAELKPSVIDEQDNVKLVNLQSVDNASVNLLIYTGKLTGKEYVFRVPPTMTTCCMAMAFLLKFNDAEDGEFDTVADVIGMVQRWTFDLSDPPEYTFPGETRDRLEWLFDIFYEDASSCTKRILDSDEGSVLVMFDHPMWDTQLTILKVIDSTTKEPHLLRVPNNMRTCLQAVAWTFGMTPDEYRPLRET